MSNTQINGRKVLVKYPSSAIFALFSDLTNFTKSLPSEMLQKNGVVATTDTLIAKAQGFEIGLKIEEKVPYTLVRYGQFGNSPVAYNFMVHLFPVGESETEFMLEMNAELSGMIKVMVGGKLQELVDKVTDQVEIALNGLHG